MEKQELMGEYVNRFFTTFRILEASGFCRFIIRKGEIVARNRSSVLYNMLVLIIADTLVTIMLWTTNNSNDALTTVEFVTIVHFTIFANLLMFHITFGDKYRGPDIIYNCIDIDILLGADETEFMRKLILKMYIIFVGLVRIAQVGLVLYLYYMFHLTILIHAVGSLYFLWIFFAYDDFCFYLYALTFLSTRARYFNVALLKLTNMKIDYIPKQSFFYKLFWKDNYDNRVTFHTRAESEDFVIALKMLFHQLRHIEQCYEFPIAGGFFTLVLGSFVTVQTFIMYIQVSAAVTRASAIAGWAVATWLYFLVLSLFTDMFNTQIEQTKLICAYIQLKPTSSAEMLKLTKDILAALEVRDARLLLYNTSYLDTGNVFKLAASTFVYITVQLQMAFPNSDESHKIYNITKSDSVEQSKRIEDVLFL